MTITIDITDTNYFKIGDTVWYMWGNQACCNRVTSIRIEQQAVLNDDESLRGINTTVTYGVCGWFREGACPTRVTDLFPDKATLLASL